MTDPRDELERLRATYWACMRQLNEADEATLARLYPHGIVIPVLRAMGLLPTPEPEDRDV